MIGYTPGPSPHSDTAVSALSHAASRPDWQCLEDVDVPLKQQPLLAAIDEALHQHLPRQHPPSVPAPWPSHLPCLMLATGSTAFHLLRWVFTFKTRSFGAVCATGWEYPFTAPPTHVPNAIIQQTPLVTTRWAVGAMGIGSPVIMPSVTSSSARPSLQLWLPPRRCQT